MPENSLISDEIKRCETALAKAMLDGDHHLLASLLHDDLVFAIPGGQVITKQMDVESYHLGLMSVEALTQTQQKIHITEDCAVVMVVVDLKAKYLDQPINGRFRYFRVWKPFKENWQVIAGICMQLES